MMFEITELDLMLISKKGGEKSLTKKIKGIPSLLLAT